MSNTESPIPRLRFPEFEGEWEKGNIKNQFSHAKQKGKKGLRAFSVTMHNGLVARDELERETKTNLLPEEHLLVEKGDIAYNMMRMWQGAFGLSEEDGIVSPAYVILKPTNDADSLFASYSFRKNRAIYFFGVYSYGLTKDRLRLYGKDCLRVPYVFPPLPEQQKIADFLTARDQKITHTTKQITQAQAFKKGLLQQMFI